MLGFIFTGTPSLDVAPSGLPGYVLPTPGTVKVNSEFEGDAYPLPLSGRAAGDLYTM